MPLRTDRAIGTSELRRRILTHLQTHADGVRRLPGAADDQASPRYPVVLFLVGQVTEG
jgi:hypothetical protein